VVLADNLMPVVEDEDYGNIVDWASFLSSTSLLGLMN